MENRMKAKNTSLHTLFTSAFAVICLGLSNNIFAQSTTDNEILIEQVGDTLNLTIIQQGYGNKISGDSTQSSDMVITGSSLNIDIDQIGNNNNFFGAMTTSNSTMDWLFTGDSNKWDILIGSMGSADSADILVDFTGDSNEVDFDLGSVVSAERLDMDFTLLGSSNIFDIDIEVDDSTWNFDITGDSNNFLTSQTDGAYHYLKVIHQGDSGDFDILQSSGTCPTGVTSCYSHIDLDIDSENATVQITVSD
jgi:hypothetical protein